MVPVMIGHVAVVFSDSKSEPYQIVQVKPGAYNDNIIYCS